MLEKIKNIDSFGVGIGLNYNGLKTHKSYIGSTFTLIFVAAGLYNCITLANQLLQRNEPSVIHNRIWNSDPEHIELSQNHFEFAFGIQAFPSFTHVLDETIYTAQAEFYTHKRVVNETGHEHLIATRTNLTLVPCHTLDYHIGKKFEGVASQQMYCIDYSKHDKVFLEGTWESPVYGALDLKLYFCQNSTSSNKVCKSQEEINKFVEGSYFQMTFSDLELDLNNNENPEKRFRNVYWDQLSPLNYRENYLYWKTVKVNTDTGLVSEIIHQKKMAGFDRSTSTFSNLKFDNGNFFNLRLKIEPQQDIYNRNYIKFTGFLAQLAALLKTYLVIIIVIINPLQNFQLYRQFIGDCCTIDQNSFDILMPIIAQSKKSKRSNDRKLTVSLSTKKDIALNEDIDDEQKAKFEKRKRYSASLDFNRLSSATPNDEEAKEEPLPSGRPFLRKQESRAKSTAIEHSKRDYNFVGLTTLQTDFSNHEEIVVDLSKKQSPGNSEQKKEEDEEEVEDEVEDQDQTKEIETDQYTPETNIFNHLKQRSKSRSKPIKPILEQKEEIDIGSFESFDPKNIQDLPKIKNFSFSTTRKSKENENNQLEKSAPVNSKVSKILTRLKNRFQPQNLKDVKMTVPEFILSWFIQDPKKKIAQKKILYQAGHDCVRDLLDVRNFLVLRNEVELLKLLLLDKQDQELFDSVAKQKINIIDKVDLLKK